MMEDELLQQAIGLVQVGDKSGAIRILKEIVTKDPKNESAWLWLAASLDKTENKIRSLQKVLEINPNNQKAKQALDRLIPPEPSLTDLVPNTSPKSVGLQKTTKPQMEFLKDLLRNLAFLIAIGVVLYIIAPDMMKQIFQVYGALFGPIAIFIVIVAAIPRKKHTKR
jgi:tetratricopeptide (TPR) repeat protein